MVAAHPARDALSDELRATLFGTASADDDPRPARLLALLRTAGVAQPTARSSSPCARPIGKRNPWPPFRPVAQWGASRFMGATPRRPPRRSLRASPSTPAPHSAPAATRRRKAACSRSTGWLAAGGCAAHSTSAQAPESSPWQPRAFGRHRCSHSIATPWRWPPRARRCGRTRSPAACRCFEGQGFRLRSGVRLGHADLICANIRAKPIAAMAPAFARHLSPGGVVVLSGLLTTEETRVLAAFCAVRLRLWRHIRLGAWATLILTP